MCDVGSSRWSQLRGQLLVCRLTGQVPYHYFTCTVSAFIRTLILPGVGSRESPWQSAHGIGPRFQTSRTVCGTVYSYSAVLEFLYLGPFWAQS